MRSIVAEGTGDLHLVILSGGFIAAEDFMRQGFVARLRERGIDCPVTVAEVRMAYFADASLRPRLASVLRSVRERGAQRVWVAGVSLGGLAALCHAAGDDDLAGLALLSPYPGTRPVLREIEQAGSLERWAAGAAPDDLDLEREAWLWLARRAPGRPPVHAWYGSGDRFAAGQRQLAQALAGENVHEVAGGHDWPDWREMWNRFLETDSLR
jgi:pimeloyl-ACP methyl ester carboxylesterase